MILKNSYSLEELLLDESFFNFYCQKNEKDILDWEDWCEDSIKRKELVLEAFDALNKLSLKWDKETIDARYKSVVDSSQLKVENPILNKKLPAINYQILTIWKYAAAAVLVVSLIALSYELINKRSAQLTAQSAQLEEEPLKRTLVRFYKLPDGTKVQLKAGSVLKLSNDFGKSERLVYLTGEAKFEVAHDSKRPFIVKTDGVSTTALGTVFVVRSNSENRIGQIALLEGKIKVEYEGNKVKSNPLILTQGSQVKFEKVETQNIISVHFSDIEKLPTQIVNWQHLKVLSIEKMKLGDVFSKLAESYEVQFKGVDKTLENYIITGTFDTNLPLSDIMEILAFSNDFKYKIQNKQVIIVDR